MIISRSTRKPNIVYLVQLFWLMYALILNKYPPWRSEGSRLTLRASPTVAFVSTKDLFNMRTFSFLAMLIFISSAWAHEPGKDQGNCDSYPWDMNREWSLYLTDAIPWKALAQTEPEARYMPMDRRVDFQLLPSDQVKLVVPADKAPKAGTHAGLAPLRVPFPKRYRISANKPVWVEVLGPNGPVASTKFAAAMGCDKLVKSVIFKLDIETDYWLQVTGADLAQVDMLITLDR